MHKTTKSAGLYWFGVATSLFGMYLVYVKIGTDPTLANLFSLVIGVLGALSGYLASQASSVKSQAQLDRILGASLIREKEAEAKTVEQAKALYELELKNLKTIIEREGNQLLLKRLKALYLEDLREKLREVESIDGEITKNDKQSVTPEVAQIRKQLEGILTNVRNPEEDDRLIREFCYSVPLIGNSLYFLYSVWKKVDPSIQDRVHNRLNQLARGNADSRPIARLVAAAVVGFFIVGIIAVVVSVFHRFSR
jgi:hypothetical protein